MQPCGFSVFIFVWPAKGYTGDDFDQSVVAPCLEKWERFEGITSSVSLILPEVAQMNIILFLF